MFEPSQGLYHMHYQSHPNHADWGNISWGHAVSEDLITWKDVNHIPGNGLEAWQDRNPVSFGTTNFTGQHNPAQYNRLGIWSGTAQPVNMQGIDDGTILAFYTAISRLPTAWNAPYEEGLESQAFAYSNDGGVTWSHYDRNPILGAPPIGWNVTGWRDPFFEPWPEMDALLNLSDPQFYLTLSSGIKDVGPRLPFYRAAASDLTNWTFLGALWEPEANSSLGSVEETGSYGFNFEVGNFFSLDGHWFITTGTQGGNVSFHQQNWSLWNQGNVSVGTNGSVNFVPISGGVADWGILYAVTTFKDTRNDRRIQYGWAWEDMSGFGITQQGFQGALSLPREIFVKRTPGVASPSQKRPGNNLYNEETDGSWTARTLGVRPAPDVVAGLREGATFSSHTISSVEGSSGPVQLVNSTNHSYELSLSIQNSTGTTGVLIGASPNFEEFTRIYFDPRTQTVVFDRDNTSLIDMFLNSTYTGHFEPYQIMKHDGSGPVAESIDMDIFVDGSLVEIFVNDRFAMTSRMYPAKEESTGIYLFSGDGVSTVYNYVKLWDGLLNVWPERPLNSSSHLVFDSAEETNNYTWWSGI